MKTRAALGLQLLGTIEALGVVLSSSCDRRADGDAEAAARQFLAERGIPFPREHFGVDFAVEDDLRSLAYVLRVEVQSEERREFARGLWCAPVSAATCRPLAQRTPWREAEALADVTCCDTNGPREGTFHFQAVVGKLPSERYRFLLSFSK